MVTVSTFQACPLTDQEELEQIVQLINTCRAADNLENRTSLRRVQEHLADPQFDQDRDLRLWRDRNGELVAVAWLWRSPPQAQVVGGLGFDIQPQICTDELATEIVVWAEQRLLIASPMPERSHVLHSGCRNSQEQRRQLLKRLGFQPERHFHRLKRTLEDVMPSPVLPNGWTIRPVAAADAEAWVAMFNQTFIDHWNHSPMSVDEFHYYATLSDYERALDLVVETPEGDLASFCTSEINAERNARLGCQEGYVGLLGTRRGYRRQGLAKALLLANLHQLKHRGMTTAAIGVDAQNPLGAVGLYHSIGFKHEYSSTVFQRVAGAHHPL